MLGVGSWEGGNVVERKGNESTKDWTEGIGSEWS